MTAGTDTHTTYLFGELTITYAEQATDDEEEAEGMLDFPLGVGTEEELVSWARMLLSDKELFPEDGTGLIEGAWISVLPTVGRRIPWDRDMTGGFRVLLLEGKLPDSFFEDGNEDVQVTQVPEPVLH